MTRVNIKPTRKRDTRMAYFTNSSVICDLMVSRLESVDGLIWEPCAGAGHLVDAVLAKFPEATMHLSEIAPERVDILASKYCENPRIKVEHEDIIANKPKLACTPAGIIANPPFGAWQTMDRRVQLKKKYPDLYVRESYALFLNECMNRLAVDGRLVFIIPDTFLWLHRHERFRRRLLNTVTWVEVVTFPSRLLPSAGFGYANLSVISFRKSVPAGGHSVPVFECQSLKELRNVISHQAQPARTVAQAQAALSARAALVSRGSMSNANTVELGEIAAVRTGFYSGNDRRWRYRRGPDVLRSNGFRDADPVAVYEGRMDAMSIQNGLEGSRTLVPMIRGGAVMWSKPTEWYCDWSVTAVQEYRRSGKNPARFQNSEFYFKEGIGVPMVAGKRLTAAMIEGRLFDQSIVGVFPYDHSDLMWLLAFLNSDEATRQMQTINPTANNSAGYLKRLRVPILGETTRQQIVSAVESLVAASIQKVIVEHVEKSCFDMLRCAIAVTAGVSAANHEKAPAAAATQLTLF